MVEGLKHFVRAQAQMKAQIIRAATLAFVVLPIGCASIVSLSASPDNPKHQCRRPQDVYGGTQLDYTGLCRRSGDGLFQHGPLALIVDIGDMAQRLVIAVDLPMCIVVDTLALPYTLCRETSGEQELQRASPEETNKP